MRRITRQEADARLRALGMYSEDTVFRGNQGGADIPYAQSQIVPQAPFPDVPAQTLTPQATAPNVSAPYASEVPDAPASIPGQTLYSPRERINRNSFGIYPFSISNTSGNNGSYAVLPANRNRVFLLIQNQSTSANMYFNLSGDAGLNIGVQLQPGVGVFFDVVTPNNPLTVYFDSSSPQPGVVVEGSPQ